jgi:hypothetical protein
MQFIVETGAPAVIRHRSLFMGAFAFLPRARALRLGSTDSQVRTATTRRDNPTELVLGVLCKTETTQGESS